MALLQNLHPLQATNLKGENQSIKRGFVQKPLLSVLYSNRLYLNKLYLKTKVQKLNLHELKNLYMKYIPQKPLLQNNSTFQQLTKTFTFENNELQNLMQTHVKDV
jgi:hypothetical protein